VFQVGVGDPSGSGVLSGSGRLDGLYVTWREGTHIRHGLSLDAYNTSSGEYETELSIPERIQSGGDTSQVLVRNPSTNELEYVPGSALGGGGGSTSITDGVGIDVDYNASTDSFVVSVSDVVAKAVDFGGPVRVTSGEIEVTTPGLGNVVRSPDGTRFRVKVKNDGTIVSEQL
jgi:hypothetical protein